MKPFISNMSVASQDSLNEEIVNLSIGRRLRRRRKLLGLTQTDLATALGLQFQQVQKYECSATRISAARLYSLASILKVPIGYFFEQLPAAMSSCAKAQDRSVESITQLLADKETDDLLTSYARLPVAVRQRLRVFAKALGDVIGDRKSVGDTR